MLFLGDALTTEADVTSNPESKQADALIAERMGGGPGPTEVVVVRSETLTADDPAFRAEIERLVTESQEAGVIPPSATFEQVEERSEVSADGNAVLIPVAIDEDDVETMTDIAAAADGREGFDVVITGRDSSSRSSS